MDEDNLNYMAGFAFRCYAGLSIKDAFLDNGIKIDVLGHYFDMGNKEAYEAAIGVDSTAGRFLGARVEPNTYFDGFRMCGIPQGFTKSNEGAKYYADPCGYLSSIYVSWYGWQISNWFELNPPGVNGWRGILLAQLPFVN